MLPPSADRLALLYRVLQFDQRRVSLEGFGEALVASDDYLPAAQLLAFAELHRNKVGKIIPPPEQSYHDEAIRILREALDEATLTQARQAGGSMTFDEAIAAALKAAS